MKFHYSAVIALLAICLVGCKKESSDEHKFTNVIFHPHLFINGNDSTAAITINRPAYSDISFSYNNGEKVITAFKSAVNNYTGSEGIVGSWDYAEQDQILSLKFTVNAITYNNPFWNQNTVKWKIIELSEGYYIELNTAYPVSNANDCWLSLDKN